MKRFSTSPVPVGAKMVVVFKAYVEHGVLLALWFAKTLADFEINDIAALPPPFWHNS